MCGIFSILIQKADKSHSHGENEILQIIDDSYLPHRGPDKQCNISVVTDDGCRLLMYGCVLHFRGSLTLQPITDDAGNMLLWNGEIFGGIQISVDENDTKILFDKLKECKQECDILEVFRSIKGPWSFIYYQAELKKLWFGRDFFGRRSLLWHLPVDNNDAFVLSSIRVGPWEWEEIPATGIYCLDNEKQIHLFPWKKFESAGTIVALTFPNKDNIIRHEEETVSLNIHTFNRSIPSDCDVKDFYQHCDHENVFSTASQEMKDLADKLIVVLSEAVKTRVTKQPSVCSNCIGEFLKATNLSHPKELSKSCIHSRLAILFSGGIDSMMIAALADRHVPADQPIDLLNVAFQLQDRSNHKNKGGPRPKNEVKFHDPYAVPDRLTGLSGLEELKGLNPRRKWNFIEVNVTIEELQDRRENLISDLVYPLKTVLDDSIGCAIWFAARGIGSLNGETYSSPARVVLVGMGADEQLGGYSRHRGIFQKESWIGLVEEIDMEIDRISSRNLGRDDRIITDHARESRFPFLDEDVVSFLNSLPVWKKMNLNLPRGFGEKYLLRLAASKLQLCQTSILPKRAIQFGSRIAKIENHKRKSF